MQGVNQKYICDSFNDSSTPKKSIWEALCFLLKYLPYCDALMYWDRGGREIEMEITAVAGTGTGIGAETETETETVTEIGIFN